MGIVLADEVAREQAAECAATARDPIHAAASNAAGRSDEWEFRVFPDRREDRGCVATKLGRPFTGVPQEESKVPQHGGVGRPIEPDSRPAGRGPQHGQRRSDGGGGGPDAIVNVAGRLVKDDHVDDAPAGYGGQRPQVVNGAIAGGEVKHNAWTIAEAVGERLAVTGPADGWSS